MSDKNKRFWELLGTLKQAWEHSTQAALAFWLGIWYGEAGRERVKKWGEDAAADPGVMFALELGIQLKPFWKEIASTLGPILVQAAVSALLALLGLKKDSS